MAIKTLIPAQLADGFRRYPIDEHGKLRFQWATVANDAVAGDDGSMVKICLMPAGRKRIVLPLCRYKVSALGASRVMKIGHRAYYDRSDPSSAAQAEDDDAFASAIDVSAAVNATFPVLAASPLKFDMFSRENVELFATITGGTIPANATFDFMIAYLYE